MNENVTKLLNASMWDLATCDANGVPNVVPVAFKKVIEDGKLPGGRRVPGQPRSRTSRPTAA